jgi:glutamine amidotransferase-like uncharacterized protein
MKTAFILALLSISPLNSHGNGENEILGRPLALVYKGAGSCEEGCSESLAKIAEEAGYRVRFVGPEERSTSVFRGASIWMQPGGLVRAQNLAMTDDLKQNIKRFVERGGGYVGICAGAFLAGGEYGWNTKKDPDGFTEGALNFFPGRSTIYWPKGWKDTAAIIPSLWTGAGKRSLYWELGPAFFETSSWKGIVEVVSRYPDQSVATMRRSYGSGKVFVTAFHPEALQEWRDSYKLTDPDGLDFDLVTKMIQWVSPKQAIKDLE